MPLDRPLQVARAVFEVSPFAQEEFPGRLSKAEEEAPLGGFEDALLHHSQLDLENLLQLLRPQRMENDDFVDAVHKLGREFSLGSFRGGSFDLFVEPRLRLGSYFRRKAEAAGHQFRYFSASQI